MWSASTAHRSLSPCHASERVRRMPFCNRESRTRSICAGQFTGSTSTLVPEGSLRAEHVVVMLGEPMGLVANVLEQTKGERPAAEDNRVGAAGHENLFLALGQRNHGR